MIIDFNQRWRDRVGTYRPKGEPIATRDYEIALIDTDTEARKFVCRHHYAGSYAPAMLRAGLYRKDELVGVAVLGPGADKRAMDIALPLPGARRAELVRFVLRDDVPANGESWFLGHVFALARRCGFEALVAYSDPEPRVDVSGRTIFRGHFGCIYQATNARYVGKTKTRTWRLFPDGTVLDDRQLTKLRERQRGWQYVAARLVEHGAEPPRGDFRQWRLPAIRAATRTVRHRGAHRYLWALDTRLSRYLPDGQRYPKIDLEVPAP